MYITREFAASRNQVWQAWTDPYFSINGGHQAQNKTYGFQCLVVLVLLYVRA